MPRATVDISTTERTDLKTLPEGFVLLRRLTYGEILERQSLLTMRMVVETDKKKRGEDTSATSEFNLANVQVTLFEFGRAIVDHNLEDDKGRKLNFTNPVDLKSLDPRVGQEIDQLITKSNKFEEQDDEGGSSPE